MRAKAATVTPLMLMVGWYCIYEWESEQNLGKGGGGLIEQDKESACNEVKWRRSDCGVI